jgi:hypothetical protein
LEFSCFSVLDAGHGSGTPARRQSAKMRVCSDSCTEPFSCCYQAFGTTQSHCLRSRLHAEVAWRHVVTPLAADSSRITRIRAVTNMGTTSAMADLIRQRFQEFICHHAIDDRAGTLKSKSTSLPIRPSPSRSMRHHDCQRAPWGLPHRGSITFSPLIWAK